MTRWELHLDDGQTVEVDEVALAPMQARLVGPQLGPIHCPACKGTGKRAHPEPIMSTNCGSCSGEGIAYPAN